MVVDQYAEIIGMLKSLEAKMEIQQGQMKDVCDFKDTAIRTFQNFEDYKKDRANLPKDVADVKSKVDACNIQCDHHKKATLEYFKKTDFLMTWYGRAAALLFSVQIIIAIMVFVGRWIDFHAVLKP